MTKVLDTYDPRGDELWGRHLEANLALIDEINGMEASRIAVPEELYKRRDHHYQAWMKAELSRHRTIQDYMRFHWAFLFAKAEKEGIPFPMPTFEDGATIDDVAALYRHYEDKIDRAIKAKHDTLSEGRPDGLDIFEPGQGRIVTSELRRFEQHLFGAEVVTLVSYDLRPTESHVCLAFVPDEIGGTSAIVRFEDIINRLYREALVMAYQTLNDRLWLEVLSFKILEAFKTGVQAFNYPIAGLIPKNMRFYLHVPAELSCRDEPSAEFKHVPVQYRARNIREFGDFRDGYFEPLDRVPPYIKHARYIEGLATPSSQPSGVFYRRAAMLLGETPSQPSLQG